MTDKNTRVICAGSSCKKRLKGKQRKFCSTTCNKRTWAQSQNGEIKEKPINKSIKADTGDSTSIRRGNFYDEFKEKFAEELAAGTITVGDIAQALGTTSATVSRMAGAYKIDVKNEIAAEGWDISEETKESLENFSSFRNRYFATETGEKYETADFHENWITNIIQAIEGGKELIILSPPRHGKTELLIHFAVYQIMKNPLTNT